MIPVDAPQAFIKHTSVDLGLRENNIGPTEQRFGNLLSNIKKIAPSVEAVTMNKGGYLAVSGKLNKPLYNGHLILNPRGVDLRFMPGKVSSAEIEITDSDKNQFWHIATFKNSQGETVLKNHFLTDTRAQQENKKTYNVYSPAGKTKQFDTSKSIETLWRELTDVHHFTPMLEQKKISRIEAFKHVPPDLARQVKKESVQQVLYYMLAQKEDVSIFIGNGAAFHIYTGSIDKIVPPNKYKGFSKIVIHGKTKEQMPAVCRLSPESLQQAWVVTKFTEGQRLTNLEVFDKEGQLIVQIYGARERGKPQSDKWQHIMNALT